MKNLRTITLGLLVAVAASAISATPTKSIANRSNPLLNVAVESDWSPFWSIGNEVSVSVTQVNSETWTWRLRNDSYSTTITYMSFYYYDKDGQHPDYLPGRLAPQSHIGGWSAFTSSSRPDFSIREITRN